MENLHFELPSVVAESLSELQNKLICGVAGSGNLEILISRQPQQDYCLVEISTSAQGFANVWQAVLDDFTRRVPAGGLLFQINDMGATPAVVGLRLEQAMMLLKGA